MIHLQSESRTAGLIWPGPGAYHASLGEDVPPSSIHRCTPAGVSITEAASSDHHVIQSVVIFVLRVPASSTQQRVTECEQTSEVHPNVGQSDQI